MVLLVDDDAVTRLLYTKCLQGAGADVVSVDSGPAALSQLGTREFDLVLLDNVMPNVTGMELLELLPSQPLVGKPRIVMMSGTKSDAMTARCEALGVEEVLIKPIPPPVLRALVKPRLEG